MVVYESGLLGSFEEDFGSVVRGYRHGAGDADGDEDGDDGKASGEGDEDEDEMAHMEMEMERERQCLWVVVFSPTGCQEMLRVLGLLNTNVNTKMKMEHDNKNDHCATETNLTNNDDSSITIEQANDRNRKKRRRKRKSRTFIATIGPTTRDFLVREFGFEPDVCAERPSPEGVGEGIVRVMEEMGYL